MKTIRDTYRVTSDLWCCTNCYLSYHYGHVYEYPREWESGHVIYSETVNTLAENGVRIDDHVCREHDSESESCRSCGSSDSGYTVFSKSRCEICEDRLAGERYRLQASHVIEIPSCTCSTVTGPCLYHEREAAQIGSVISSYSCSCKYAAGFYRLNCKVCNGADM